MGWEPIQGLRYTIYHRSDRLTWACSYLILVKHSSQHSDRHAAHRQIIESLSLEALSCDAYSDSSADRRSASDAP